MRRVIFRLWLALLPAACGPLPHPFDHSAGGSPSVVPRLLIPIAVTPVDGAPDLAGAIVAALDKEDIAATATAAGGRFLVLRGTIEGSGPGQRLVWRIAGADGHPLGDSGGGLPDMRFDPGRQAELATAVAAAAARLVRGDDSGVADLEARPKVSLGAVTASGGFDGEALKSALAGSLARQGLAVTDGNGAFSVEGSLRVIPGEAGKDLVEVRWTVRDSTGKEMGTVSQGSPVPRQTLLGQQGLLAHQIAEGGAEGIGQLISRAHPGG